MKYEQSTAQSLRAEDSIVNSLRPSDAYMPRLARPALAQIMAWRRQAIIWSNAELLLIET